jgi:hypothetical protein
LGTDTSVFDIPIVLALVTAFGIAPLGAQTDARLAIIVRAYDTFGVHPRDWATSQRTTSAILSQAAVGTIWHECRTARGPSARPPRACEDRLGRHELVVRLTPAPRSDLSASAFGYAHVNSATGRGSLATVFPDRVLAAAHRLGLDRGELLGRAIAHEIGHLLMGSRAHAADGLMRSHWSDDLLRNERRRESWLFTPIGAYELQRAIVTRSGSPAPVADAYPNPVSLSGRP